MDYSLWSVHSQLRYKHTVCTHITTETFPAAVIISAATGFPYKNNSSIRKSNVSNICRLYEIPPIEKYIVLVLIVYILAYSRFQRRKHKLLTAKNQQCTHVNCYCCYFECIQQSKITLAYTKLLLLIIISDHEIDLHHRLKKSTCNYAPQIASIFWSSWMQYSSYLSEYNWRSFLRHFLNVQTQTQQQPADMWTIWEFSQNILEPNYVERECGS